MSVRKVFNTYTRKIKPTLFDSGIGSRLPEAYKKFYNEYKSTPEPVHYKPHLGKIWVRDEKTGEVKRVENIPLPMKIPKELHNVFTGGEGVIQGFLKKKKYSHRLPHFWIPKVYRSVIYSEVLDKYLSVWMTKRVVELIHKHRGLDSYLLQTKACDLKTFVALKLKRKILEALSTKNLPYDEDKNNKIFEKYKEYLISPEEIEWYGLNFTEACNKQKEIEEQQKKNLAQPLKHFFRAQLIQELSEEKSENSVSNEIKKSEQWYQKVPGISKLTKEK